MWRLLRWLMEKRGDMVWNTLVIVTVMIPLMGFTIDIPRYFILRNTLQNATDSAAEAAAQTLDAAAFINAGEVRLSSYASQSAHTAFDAAASPMTSKGYTLSLDGISVDESNDSVSATAHGDIRYLFGLTPTVTIRVQAQSRYRSIRE
jgi:Flp pilus assembly protein TadG